MRFFDVDRFRADMAVAANHPGWAPVPPLQSGRWKVRGTWYGWIVVDPEGRVHLSVGRSAAEWRIATQYAHHAAEVLA